MNSVLDNEHSDLVVLNGDLISCEYVAPGKDHDLIDRIVAPLVNRNVPFAATFGNHDYSETCNPRSMASHMWWDIKGRNGNKLSFTTQSVEGPTEEIGWSNYFIPVYSATDGSKLEMLLWFFDSKGGHIYQPGANLNIPTTSYVDKRVCNAASRASSRSYTDMLGCLVVPRDSRPVQQAKWPSHSQSCVCSYSHPSDACLPKVET
jgi:hypothetical protein